MKGNRKINVVIQVLVLIGIVFFVNFFSNLFYSKTDLTDDGRHTISKVSRKLVANLKHPIFVTIYFGGELSAYYETYEQGMESLLSELEEASDGLFDYQFIDPSDDPEIIGTFEKQGFPPIPLSGNTSFTSQEQILVLPYVEVNYQKQTSRLNLIQNAYQWNQEGTVHIYVDEALRRFEYLIVSEVFKLTRDKYKSIGILKGHGEHTIDVLGDLHRDSDRFYNFIQVDLSEGKEISPAILDLLLIMQPETELSEREKYEIDQYLMRGGQVLMLMDFEKVDFSVGEQISAMTFLRNTNLDDLLLKHGVKLQYNLLNDPSHGKLSAGQMTAAFGSENVQVNWPYFPKIWDFSSHPTTRYLGKVLMRYASSIDTSNVAGIKKTVLMRTSSPTRIRKGVQYINLEDELRKQKEQSDRQFYDQPAQITGILVEGQFESLFTSRGVPRDSAAPNLPQTAFASSSMAGRTPRLVLISDGDFAKGIRGPDSRLYLPLENKTMVMNLIDYMTGQDLLFQLRPRVYNERALDSKKVVGNRFLIQLVNIALPMLILLIFALGRGFWRKRVNKKRAQSA